MQTHHRFVLALTASTGEALGQYPVTPDWQPAREAVSLCRLRAGSDQPLPEDVPLSIDPIWDQAQGEPSAVGVAVSHEAHTVAVPLRYFRGLSQELGAKLVEEKKLGEGAKFSYELLAYRAPAPAPPARPPFTITALPVTLPFREVEVADWTARSAPDGTPGDENFPVFLEPQVLEEARACTTAAEGVETGGVLIGHLLRDRATRDLALWITAQIPAQHAPATTVKLSFTPDTWVSVRAAISLRNRGEQMLGTWHSHPAIAWCAKCPPEQQRECGLRMPFFSDDDVLLHRTVFGSAFCVGLVVTQALDGLRHGLFGWRAGLIEPRGFHLLGAEPVPNLIPDPAHAPTCPTHA
ncbi:MAG TPA: Mov34/MPN/PAD-1 family protein [Chthoniobacteraceae bacterium]|jgi:hypothetical protein|nr:Mov34/MPN/PAD-1 family protein [Chthoniobacteraceae bacterium]